MKVLTFRYFFNYIQSLKNCKKSDRKILWFLNKSIMKYYFSRPLFVFLYLSLIKVAVTFFPRFRLYIYIFTIRPKYWTKRLNLFYYDFAKLIFYLKLMKFNFCIHDVTYKNFQCLKNTRVLRLSTFAMVGDYLHCTNAYKGYVIWKIYNRLKMCTYL